MPLKKSTSKSAFKSNIRAEVHAGKPVNHSGASEDFKRLVAQIYTNRSLAFHSLNQQASAMSDSAYVLDHIDAKNPKALFRRAFALKSQGRFEEAGRYYQLLMKEAGNPTVKKDLDECMMAMIEAKKKAAEVAKNQPKITELAQDPKTFKKVEIQEESDSDDEIELQKKKSAAKGKTAMIDAVTLANAQEKAAEVTKAQTLH